MQRDDIKSLMRVMFGQNIVINDQPDWVMVPCPFAPWRHDTGRDRKPSFGVSVKDQEESNYHCFTCKSKGRLFNLPSRLSRVSKDPSWLEYQDEIPEDESLGGRLPSWGSLDKSKVRKTIPDPLPNSHLHIYDSVSEDHPYLKERGIAYAAARSMDLRVDYDDSGQERILFPLYSIDGGFYGYTGRAVTECTPKVRDYYGLPKEWLLLGTQHVIQTEGRIVLVEGLFDYANVFQHGVSVLASLGSNITEHQADVLKRLGRPLVVMYDDDRSGKQGSKEVKQLLGKHIPLMKVKYPKNVKGGDPGSLTKNQLYRMLGDTRLL